MNLRGIDCVRGRSLSQLFDLYFLFSIFFPFSLFFSIFFCSFRIFSSLLDLLDTTYDQLTGVILFLLFFFIIFFGLIFCADAAASFFHSFYHSFYFGYFFFAFVLLVFDTMLLCSCTCLHSGLGCYIASSTHFRALASILPAIFPIHDAVSLPDFSFRLLLLSGSSIHIILDWTLYMQCLAICYCSFWHSGVYSLISEHLSADLSFGLLLLA